MRANTSRRSRFAFDRSAEAYAQGRPTFDGAIGSELVRAAGLARGDSVLEIGAGTGQLTGALLGAGLRVTALEPGPRMAGLLRRRFPVAAELQVLETTFEQLATDARYAAVCAANSFHWLDPAVSYRGARELLLPGRPLITLWNFPILVDAALQQRVNREVFVAELEDLRREPEGYEDWLEQLLAEGRAELERSGCFAAPRWQLRMRNLSLSRDAYVDLQASYANAVDSRPALCAGVARVLDAETPVEVLDYVYFCVASRSSAER